MTAISIKRCAQWVLELNRIKRFAKVIQKNNILVAVWPVRYMAGHGWAEFSYISILIMGLGAMPYLVSMKSRLMLQCGVP